MLLKILTEITITMMICSAGVAIMEQGFKNLETKKQNFIKTTEEEFLDKKFTLP